DFHVTGVQTCALPIWAPVHYADLEALFQSADVEQFIDPTSSFPEAREAARSFFYHVYRLNLRPTNLVVYEREAFMGRFDPTLRKIGRASCRERVWGAV